MIDPADVHSLTDFQRNTKRHLARLKKTRRPAVLTVNGRAAAVVLDPATYKRLADLASRTHEIELIRQGTADMRAGRFRPLSAVARDLRKRALGLDRQPATRKRRRA